MNVTLKNKYPLKLAFNARQSNSSFIRDLNAVNLSFDNNSYLRNLKTEAVEKLKLFYSNNSSLINLKDSIILQKAKYAKLKSEFNEPARILSQAAANVLIIRRMPEISGDSLATFFIANCENEFKDSTIYMERKHKKYLEYYKFISQTKITTQKLKHYSSKN